MTNKQKYNKAFIDSFSIDESKYPSVPEGFVFRSDTNDKWLDQNELREMIKEMEFE